ncbi:MAG: transglycosylase SLT domain-containing protein [Pseudomonadales bacterium]|nr:transglycosylase SLT domain-containing protein [Pseudomonadales bacterium]NIX09562.1 transglycosylase SLT domain-containing protein [Pseudomonadales bacterium]
MWAATPRSRRIPIADLPAIRRGRLRLASPRRALNRCGYRIRHCLALSLLLVAPSSPTIADDGEARTPYQQRTAYRAALSHLRVGNADAFRRIKSDLRGYSLHPYLDYHDLRNRLSSASPSEVLAFREEHADLPVTPLLYRRWLERLGQRREWKAFLDHYEESSDPELRCYHGRALYGTGRKEVAFADVAELWVVGESQPEACDPLFKAWIDNDNLTEGMVWERLNLALQANQRQLARYLQRFFSGSRKPWAQSFYNVHVTPNLVARADRFETDNELSRAVIAHGLRRLATRDAETASAAWQRYRRSHDFAAETIEALDQAVAVALAGEGTFPTQRPGSPTSEFVLGMAKAAVAQQNWSEAYYWIDRLPPETISETRWQYWSARAVTSTHLDSERARLALRALAERRDYYGFLAAERLGLETKMNHSPLALNPIQTLQLNRMPPVQRALELQAVGDLLNARREWNAVLPGLDEARQVQAAFLIQQSGWTSQAIRMANAARLTDHLDLRFPRAYPEYFKRASHVTAIPESFLIAIARQESAFDARARSHADALGLMQLLPSTAKRVARRSGLSSPSDKDLLNPAVNVEIASHHLAELLLRYGNRRPLAAAAYNAGANRVDRWIRDASGVPMDVWIETIPFYETRNYVKNVLAFAQVYGRLLGAPVPMLHVHESSLP